MSSLPSDRILLSETLSDSCNEDPLVAFKYILA